MKDFFDKIPNIQAKKKQKLLSEFSRLRKANRLTKNTFFYLIIHFQKKIIF